MIKHELFETNLEVRMIDREGDTDFFLLIDFYPVNLELGCLDMSRIQFPLTRAIIVRTTPHSKWVTLHMLQDTDLHSSIANFELNLEHQKLFIMQEEGYVRMSLLKQGSLS